MLDYQVTVEAREPEAQPMSSERAAEATAALTDALAQSFIDDAACGVGGDPVRWTATFTVWGALAVEATAIAVGRFNRALNTLAVAAEITAVSVARTDVADERLARPAMPDLVSGPEAAEILGVSVQRVHQLAATRSGFPAPAYKFPGASLWHRAAIEAFNARWERKPGRPRNPSAA